MDRIEVRLDEEWFSVADACDYMGVLNYVIKGQLRAGRLPGVRFDREWRVVRQNLEEWSNRERSRNSPGPSG